MMPDLTQMWVVFDPNTGVIPVPPVFQATEKFVPPSGYEVIGPLDGADATNQDCAFNPSHYTVQSGVLVKTVTDAQLLSQVQTKQIATLRAGYAQTIAGGFVCTVSGTSVTFGWSDEDQKHLLQVNQAIDKGIDTFPIPYSDIHGSAVSIPDQATLTAVNTASDHFDWAQVKQLRTLIGQVQAATTVAAVEAIVWQAASY